MPWRHTAPLDQKPLCIADSLRDRLSITALCPLYQVSRQTGYLWLDHYLRYGPAGLDERSCQPHACPRQTPEAGVAAIIDARRQHPTWGAKPRRALLTTQQPRDPEPTRAGAPPTPAPTPRPSWETGHPQERAPPALDR
jgi:hypothetical protein